MKSFTDVVTDALEEITAIQDRKAYKNDPVLWAKNVAGVHLWSAQAEVAEAVARGGSIAVKAGHGVGKALSLDTPLPTPTGWTTMGDVRPGDYLLDENSYPTPVVAVSEIWNEDTYRVHFDDGTFVDAAAQHEWSVLDLSKRTAAMKRGVKDWRGFWDDTIVVETQELFQDQKTSSGQNRWRIPAAKSMIGNPEPLIIDPYVLGAWLGDGNSRGAQITTHPDDHEIIERIAAEGYNVRKLANQYLWSFADNGFFVSCIRDMDLYRNKHIPSAYLRASEDQRIALLQGLLDTDGSVDDRGVVTIDLMSESLARGVVELVRTLGGRATIKPRPAMLNGRTVGTRWRMTLKVQGFIPFHLKRKADRFEAAQGKAQVSRATQRTIVKIEKIDTKPTRCVEVSSERHLFLAGEGMIPTHNSYLSALLICWWIDTRYPDCFVASTAPSTAQISAIVWREVHSIRNSIEQRFKEGLIDHKLPGYITSEPSWKTDDGVVIGFGRRPPERSENGSGGDSGDAFQGIHAREGVLAIGDEAVGLSEKLIDALGNITSTSNSARLLICNPTNPLSYVAKLFKNKPENWSFHTISVLNSPNFTDEKDVTPPEVLEALTDQSYVEQKRAEYGEGSPQWVSRIEGEFAWDMGFTLFRPENIEKGYDTEIIPSPDTLPVLGVDVSRSKAGDKNTVYKYHDGILRFVEDWNEPNAINTANKVHELALAHAVSEVRIDGSGLGGPIADYIRDLAGDRYEVIEILGSNASPDINRYANFRAWSYADFQTRLAQGLIDLDVNDDELAEQLLGMEIKKKLYGKDNLLLESKQDMARRNVHSPDHADAANYACVDLSAWTGNPYNSMNIGDTVVRDMQEYTSWMDELPLTGAGIPIL